MVPNDAHPNPQSLWLCYLTCQKGFSRCDESRVFSWGDYPGCLVGPMYQKGLEQLKREAEKCVKERGVTTEAERCYIASFEDEGWVAQAKEFTQFLEAAKVDGFSPTASRKPPVLPQLEFSLLRPVLDL